MRKDDPAAKKDREQRTRLAASWGIPAEVLLTLPHSSSVQVCEDAAYIYRVARSLQKAEEGKPNNVDSPVLEEWIQRRYEIALKEHGTRPGPKCHFRTEMLILSSLVPSPPRTPTPPGWQGEPPKEEIKTLNQLRENLEMYLRLLREWGLHGTGGLHDVHRENAINAWRNAWRVFDHLGTVDRRARPDHEPSDAIGVERELSELIRWLKENGTETLLTTPELAALAGVAPEKFADVFYKAQKHSDENQHPPKPAEESRGRRPAAHNYATILPWLRRTWPKVNFPESPADAKHEAEKRIRKTRGGD